MKTLGHMKKIKATFSDVRSAVQGAQRGRKDPLRALDLSELEPGAREEAMAYLSQALHRERDRFADAIVWHTKSGAWYDVISSDPLNRWKATICGIIIADHSKGVDFIKAIAGRFLEEHLQETLDGVISDFSREDQEKLRELLEHRDEIIDHRQNNSRLFGDPLPEHLREILMEAHEIDANDEHQDRFVNSVIGHCKKDNPTSFVRTILLYKLTEGPELLAVAENQRAFTTLVLEEVFSS